VVVRKMFQGDFAISSRCVNSIWRGDILPESASSKSSVMSKPLRNPGRTLGRSCRTGGVALLLAFALAAPIRGGEPLSPEAISFFESKVRPVLVENCYKCHGTSKQKGGLRLDSRAAILAGGDQGKVVVPGSPEKSLFVKAIRYDGDLKMPPAKK